MKSHKIFISFLLFFTGILNGFSIGEQKLLPSEVVRYFKAELSKVYAVSDDQEGELRLEKRDKKGELHSATLINILKIESKIISLELIDLTVSGDLDFAKLPKKSHFGLKVHLVDKNLRFERCTFKGKINPEKKRARVSFNETLVFLECEFLDEVSFEKSTFKNVSFNDCHFEKDAIFYRSEFRGDKSSFLRTKFFNELIFSASFFDRIDFTGLLCKKKAQFKYIESETLIDFSESTFEGEADFSCSKLKGKATFEDCTFASQLFFYKVNDDVKASTIINFNGSNFKKKAYFRDTFFADVSFCLSKSRPLIFLDEADFIGARFNKTHFRKASFETADFSHAIFKKKTDMNSLSFKDTSYKKLIITWNQIAKALGDDMSVSDYRRLKENFEELKKHEDACEAYYKMKSLERKNLKSLFDKMISYSAWLFGYFVKPWKILLESLILIIFFSLILAGTKLENFKSVFSRQIKDERIFIIKIPIEPIPDQKKEEMDSGKLSHREKKYSQSKFLKYIKNLPSSFYFSLTLFLKFHFCKKYLSSETKKWIKLAARFEWLLGYGMLIIFIISLSRKSSILLDIFKGLKPF